MPLASPPLTTDFLRMGAGAALMVSENGQRQTRNGSKQRPDEVDDDQSQMRPGSEPPKTSQEIEPPTKTIESNVGQQRLEPWTITFVDWDNTLFPTSWLENKGLLDPRQAPKEPEALAELEKLEQTACSALASACQLSARTCIVTNAISDWVTESSQFWMPRLHALLNSPNGPRVVYARNVMKKQVESKRFSVSGAVTWRETRVCGEEASAFLTQAKTIAMKAEIEAFNSQYPQQSLVNIISIGDGTYERHAIQEIAFMCEQPQEFRAKVFKFIANPNPTEVNNQLQAVKTYLPTIVQYNDSLDVDFDDLSDSVKDSDADALPTGYAPMIVKVAPLWRTNPELLLIGSECQTNVSPAAGA